MYALFALYGLPRRLIDVGCGDAHVVKTAWNNGVESYGVDLHVPQTSSLTHREDLRTWIPEPGHQHRYNWVLCWETAEHLPPKSADHLCDTLVQLMRTDGLLFFTAATPGQGGSDHLNEQPHQYWIEKLTARGLIYDDEDSEELQLYWSTCAGDAWWYGQNAMVFRRQ